MARKTKSIRQLNEQLQRIKNYYGGDETTRGAAASRIYKTYFNNILKSNRNTKEYNNAITNGLLSKEMDAFMNKQRSSSQYRGKAIGGQG